MADGAGYLVGNLQIGRSEVDVIGDQRRPRTHRGDACRRMNARLAKVGTASNVCRDLVADTLELALANACQILTFWNGCRLLVKINRDSHLAPQALSAHPSEPDAVVHRNPRNRHERNDIGRAHTRMFTGMLVQIYQFSRSPGSRDGRVHHAIGWRNKRDY